MNPQAIDFVVTDVRGRQHALQAVNVEGGGWRLQACIDGRVFTHRCRDWQAVERTIQRLRARPADPGRPAASAEPGSARALVAGVLLVVSIREGSWRMQAHQRPTG
jgi:hypothetical protein